MLCFFEQSTGEDGGAISPECFTVLLEAEARCHGPETSLEPAACSESTEAGIETGFGEEDGADVGPPQDSEGLTPCGGTVLQILRENNS